MARYEHLPVYKSAYQLLQLVGRLVQNMPRTVKPVLGARLHQTCEEVIQQIWRANDRPNAKKGPPLTRLIERVRAIELLLRVSRDGRFISIPQYSDAVILTESISKQAWKWRERSASPVT